MDPLTLTLLGIGAMLGWASWGLDIDKNNKEKAAKDLAEKEAAEAAALEKQQQAAEAQAIYEAKVNDQKLQFAEAKKEASENAKKADESATKAEGYLSSEYNNLLDQLGLTEKMQNTQMASAIISNSQSTGAAHANIATNGARSSSVMGAVQRSEAFNEKQMQQSVELQNLANQYQLNQYTMGIAQNRDAITEQRYQANKLRSSYLEGGSNYKLFQSQLGLLALGNDIEQAQYQRAVDNLSTDPNKTVTYTRVPGANGAATTYKSQYAINKAYSDKVYSLRQPGFLDLVSNMFNGATIGFKLGGSLSDFNFKWGSN